MHTKLIKIILGILLVAIMLGVVLPWLVSAKSTVAVLAAIAIVIAAVYVTAFKLFNTTSK